MKKLILLAMTLFITTMASAQMSVQLGYLLNTDHTKDLLGKYSYSYSGIMAAVDYNVKLSGEFGVAPGLGLDFSFNNEEDAKYKELGINVPIDFNYRFALSDAVSLSVFAGPSLYFGLLSKDTAEGKEYNYYDNESRRFNVYLGGGVWCDIKETIRVKAGYKFGLADVNKLDTETERNNILSVSVGYLF